ncbi:type II toxin-antitoxin system RelB/DinJ family antitoxin [Adlercreutzia sp. R7]|uniref:Type II toxin-antitoxin system RelB/DinJ family antitoxin n=1 Tax=Adlercreutzia wanghongyangiae TaxID=3111451 RepID=A0ABU6IFL5_9ACTN|nr:type II toxin-antitoxin system RelB/DinJ family antitoxin [Adlercreutzia sp. R7]
MANSNVTIRIDDELKKQADEMFDELGMSFTTAVNVFVKQALREGALPFDVTLHPRKPRTYDYGTENLDD